MKPLIIKYATESPKKMSTVVFKYDPETECNILSHDENLDLKKYSIHMSGSLITDACGDPTNDESTDR